MKTGPSMAALAALGALLARAHAPSAIAHKALYSVAGADATSLTAEAK